MILRYGDYTFATGSTDPRIESEALTDQEGARIGLRQRVRLEGRLVREAGESDAAFAARWAALETALAEDGRDLILEYEPGVTAYALRASDCLAGPRVVQPVAYPAGDEAEFGRLRTWRATVEGVLPATDPAGAPYALTRLVTTWRWADGLWSRRLEAETTATEGATPTEAVAAFLADHPAPTGYLRGPHEVRHAAGGFTLAVEDGQRLQALPAGVDAGGYARGSVVRGGAERTEVSGVLHGPGAEAAIEALKAEFGEPLDLAEVRADPHTGRVQFTLAAWRERRGDGVLAREESVEIHAGGRDFVILDRFDDPEGVRQETHYRHATARQTGLLTLRRLPLETDLPAPLWPEALRVPVLTTRHSQRTGEGWIHRLRYRYDFAFATSEAIPWPTREPE